MLPIEELPKYFPYELMRKQVEVQPYPIVYMTVTDLHMYGMDHPDSEYVLRGIHVPSLKRLYGQDYPETSIDSYYDHNNIRIDFVTEHVNASFNRIIADVFYEIENLFSPLVVHTTPEHQELKEIVESGLSVRLADNYLSRAEKHWHEFCVRPHTTSLANILYLYRTLLTGIHLLRTGEIQVNLKTLGEEADLPAIDDLFEYWLADSEEHRISKSEIESYEPEYKRLVAEFKSAFAKSTLPKQPGGHEELKALLIRIHQSY